MLRAITRSQSKGRRSGRFVLGIFTTMLVLAVVACLAPGAEQSPESALSSELPSWEDHLPGTMDVLGSLVIVIALVFALAWVFKRVSGGRGFSKSHGKSIRVVETRLIGRSQALHLVRLGDRILLLGSGSDGSLNTLTELDDPEFAKQVCETADADRSFAGHFLEHKLAKPSNPMRASGGLR